MIENFHVYGTRKTEKSHDICSVGRHSQKFGNEFLKYDFNANFSAEIVCPLPPKPDHANKVLKGLKLNDRVTFTCDPGYAPMGMNFQVCDSAGRWWTLEDFSCAGMTCSVFQVILLFKTTLVWLVHVCLAGKRWGAVGVHCVPHVHGPVPRWCRRPREPAVGHGSTNVGPTVSYGPPSLHSSQAYMGHVTIPWAAESLDGHLRHHRHAKFRKIRDDFEPGWQLDLIAPVQVSATIENVLHMFSKFSCRKWRDCLSFRDGFQYPSTRQRRNHCAVSHRECGQFRPYVHENFEKFKIILTPTGSWIRSRLTVRTLGGIQYRFISRRFLTVGLIPALMRLERTLQSRAIRHFCPNHRKFSV